MSNSSIFAIAPIFTLQFLFSPHGLDELASSAEATTLLRLGAPQTAKQADEPHLVEVTQQLAATLAQESA